MDKRPTLWYVVLRDMAHEGSERVVVTLRHPLVALPAINRHYATMYDERMADLSEPARKHFTGIWLQKRYRVAFYDQIEACPETDHMVDWGGIDRVGWCVWRDVRPPHERGD